jgi:ribosome recycling factor
VPPLTQERRKEMGKQVGKLAEEGKVALRNVRRDALKALEKLEKDKLLSEDQLTAAKEAMEKAIGKFTKEVDALAEAKTKELMQV